MNSQRVHVRRGFLTWALLVFLVLTPFLVYAVADYIESRHLALLVAEIREAKQPTASFEVRPFRPALTGEAADAARYYRAAAALAPPWAQPSQTLAEESLGYLDRAAKLRFEQFPGGTSYSYFMGELLRVHSLSRDRTRRLADNGDGAGAAASLYSQLRLNRAVDVTIALPIAISRQIEDLQYVLERIAMPPASLALLASELKVLDRDDLPKEIMIRQRAYFLEAGLRAATWPWRPMALRRIASRLERFRDLIERASRPWPRRFDPLPADFNTLDRDVQQRYADEDALRVTAEATARVRAARLAIAALQYRTVHGGWPTQLTALVPDYLTSIPIDPYRGEPMRAIVAEDGAMTMYSVGLNNRDERGALSATAGRVQPGLSTAMAEGDTGLRIPARPVRGGSAPATALPEQEKVRKPR